MAGLNSLRRRALFLSCSSVLALAACAAGRDLAPLAVMPDLEHLDAGQVIQTTAQHSDASHALQWWTLYRDPQLDDLIAASVDEAPSIAAAAARIRRAEAALGTVEADAWPSVTGSGQLTRERFPDHYTYPAPYADSWGNEGVLTADLRYRLDFWGKQREAEAAAEERLAVAKAEAADAALVLQTAIVEAYVQLDAAYRTRDIAASGLSRRQGVIDLLVLRTKAGLATAIDAVQAQEAITETRSEIARLDGEIARRRYQIAALLGRDPAFAERLVRPTLITIANPAPLSAIPTTLLGYRPDVTMRRAMVEAAAHDIGVARAAFYPELDLTAFVGLKSFGFDRLLRLSSSAVGGGPAITLPIFDGGRLRGNLKGRTAEYDAAVSAYNAAIATALQQVADGIASLKSEFARRAEAEAALAHWISVVDLQKIRERHGLSSASDRLASETALLLSERRAAEACARIAIAQVTLIRALGGAWAPSSPIPTAAGAELSVDPRKMETKP
ncbi:efflux transporter outer membrane subunit [Magnetospirillum sp. 15-1]|uniref:efflux transporter outer membrane subunit n=1 Tax=Magnetospirillum sp. 15-1 TaxID=1979370 RepID=UPI001482B1A6|nr:efflux transporter outer membrane subunit [Magnetospirillum sp. 15-1]